MQDPTTTEPIVTEEGAYPRRRFRTRVNLATQSRALRQQEELREMVTTIREVGDRLNAIVEGGLVTRVTAHSGLKAKVTDLLTLHGPMRKKQIAKLLTDEGVTFSPNGLGTMLSSEFVRVDEGTGKLATWAPRP